MGLLPDIVDGQLVIPKEDRAYLKRISNNTIDPEKKKKFAEQLAKIKAKRAVEEAKNVDSELAKLNNEGHNEVTEDFSDSPFADRAPEQNEEDETNEGAVE